MHPLVSAFASRRDLVAEHCASESIAWRAGLSLLIDHRDRWIDEIMASVSVPKFLVGFFMGANCQVMLIWLWQVNGDGIREVKKYLDYEHVRHPEKFPT